MRNSSAIGLATCLIFGACQAAELPAEIVYDTEGWIETSPPGPPSTKPPLTGGDEADDEAGDEAGDEGGMWWSLGGVLSNGSFSDLEGEFFASDEGEEICAMFFGVELLSSVSDCAECQYAWEFRFHSPETEVDIDCSGAGNVDGSTMKVGIGGAEVYVEGPDGWEPVGEVNEEDGRTYLDWPG